MKKRLFGFILTTAMVGTMTITSFAAQGGWTESNGRWWYDNGDNTYKDNGWHWIDDNQDGTAECYYFDDAGWLLTNAQTPDGYSVDGNGAWVDNGVVQTKTMELLENVSYQQDEFTGEFELVDAMSDPLLTVTKNEDGTYRVVKTANGMLQYDRNVRKEERKEGADYIRFIDTEDDSIVLIHYDESGRVYYSESFNAWCRKPDYAKLAELKANRRFEGTFFLEANPDTLMYVTKKSNNLYHFKEVYNETVIFEYDAVPKQYEGMYYYDCVEFYDAAEGYYHLSYELDKTSDHYSYCCPGEGYADVWEPVNR